MKTYTILTALLLSLAGCSQKTETSTPASDSSTSSAMATKDMTYKDYVAPLTPISFEDLAKKIAGGEKFYLFLGRESCQYCNIFVPKLYQVLQDKPTTVYYYNTEDRTDQNLQVFRQKFGIETVPNFSYYEGDQQVATLHKGSQSSPEEIADLLSRLEQ